jgi:hypothetical protein
MRATHSIQRKTISSVTEKKWGLRTSMKDKEEKLNPNPGEDQGAVSSGSAANPPETPNRRELIERYGKYAIVAAPLLLFASKARAIHSVP